MSTLKQRRVPGTGDNTKGWSATPTNQRDNKYTKRAVVPPGAKTKWKLPKWEWYKWLALVFYGLFGFIWIYALVQGAYNTFAPALDWAGEKLFTPAHLGGAAGDILYVDMGVEFLGDDLAIKAFTTSHLKEGESLKECRIYCLNHPDCVFFSLYSENFKTTLPRQKCFLKGIGVTERVVNTDYDSGVLLNRIPVNQRKYFGPRTPKLFYYTQEELIEFPHLDVLGVPMEEVGSFNGAAGRYFSSFLAIAMPDDTKSLVVCYQKCFHREGGCSDFLYNRNDKRCMLQTSTDGITAPEAQNKVNEAKEA